MIALHSDCLIFKNDDGEIFPLGVKDAVLHFVGSEPVELGDIEIAVKSVLIHFAQEPRTEPVTHDEFAEVLQSVLDNMGYKITLIPAMEIEKKLPVITDPKLN